VRKRLEAAGLAREVMQVVAGQPDGGLVERPVYVLLGVGARPGHLRETLQAGGIDWITSLDPLAAPSRSYVQTHRGDRLTGSIVSADGTRDVGGHAASAAELHRYFDTVRAAADPGDWLGLKYPSPSSNWIHGLALSQGGAIGLQPFESVDSWRATMVG